MWQPVHEYVIVFFSVASFIILKEEKKTTKLKKRFRIISFVREAEKPWVY